MLALRDTREKAFVPKDGLSTQVEGRLVTIQRALYDRALAFLDEHTAETDGYAESF